eukprot:13047-Heterococcus_DN1.PRE.2
MFEQVQTAHLALCTKAASPRFHAHDCHTAATAVAPPSTLWLAMPTSQQRLAEAVNLAVWANAS